MSPLISTILSLLFLVVGGLAFGIMLVKLGGKQFHSPSPEVAAPLHRVLGWLFYALYLTVFFGMLFRVTQYWEQWPPHVAIHVALAFALFILLALKVVIPRHASGLGKHLFLLGGGVYLLSFVLVSITAGHYLVHKVRGIPYVNATVLPKQLVDPRLGLDLVILKCSTCHPLRDVMIRRQGKDWETVVNRMVQIAVTRISAEEATQVLDFVTKEFAPGKASGTGTPVDEYCSPCHSNEYLGRKQFDKAGWDNVVRRMSKKAPDIVPSNKINTIVEYLIGTGLP